MRNSISGKAAVHHNDIDELYLRPQLIFNVRYHASAQSLLSPGMALVVVMAVVVIVVVVVVVVVVVAVPDYYTMTKTHKIFDDIANRSQINNSFILLSATI